LSAEIDLPDGDAWKLAAAFYSARRNGKARDPVGAYMIADSGDGDYALHVSPAWVQELQQAAALAATIPHTAMPLTRREALLWAMGLLVAATALASGVVALAGVF
jgi:hypothetical protein